MERTETKCLHLNSSQDKSAVWHARLGHLGKDALKIMMTKELVTGIPRLEVTKELLFDPATRRIVVSRNVEFCEDQNWEWSKSGGDSQGKFGNFKLRLEDIENRDPENSSEEDEIGECDSGNRSNEELSENEGDIELPSEQLDAPRRSQRKDMSSRFEMSDLGGLTYYLGIEVSQQRGRIALKQEAYAKKILSEAGMDPKIKLTLEGNHIDQQSYRKNTVFHERASHIEDDRHLPRDKGLTTLVIKFKADSTITYRRKIHKS
ncbi:hypothetical protein V2J09_016636 [Rumex salicifolius]